MAVIECVPPVSPEVVNVAVPPLSVPMPSTEAPSLNVTVPVGVPEPVPGFTVAVNVTAWLKADGFSEEVNVVADKEEPVRPQDANLKDPMRVFQLNEPLVVRYSFAYQKVQSSAGSMLIPL